VGKITLLSFDKKKYIVKSVNKMNLIIILYNFLLFCRDPQF